VGVSHEQPLDDGHYTVSYSGEITIKAMKGGLSLDCGPIPNDCSMAGLAELLA
jgi:hypothetical protein